MELANTQKKAPRVLLAVPTLDRNLSVEFLTSLAETMNLCQAYGILVDLGFLGGDQFVAKARNHLATGFLTGELQQDQLFFIDADQGWEAPAFVRAVLDSHEIVAGAVPKKTDDIVFNNVDLVVDENGQCTVENGMLEVKRVGTGYMRITRAALQRYVEAYPERYAPGDGSPLPWHYEIFKAATIYGEPGEIGKFWGEDMDFCNRWVAIGGRLWIDPNITFRHAGRKVWEGNYFEYLRANHSVSTYEMQVPAIRAAA